MSDQYTYYCFKTVLPKIDFKFWNENDQHLMFYKEDTPMLNVEKAHRLTPYYIEKLLKKVGLTHEQFSKKLKECKLRSPT